MKKTKTPKPNPSPTINSQPSGPLAVIANAITPPPKKAVLIAAMAQAVFETKKAEFNRAGIVCNEKSAAYTAELVSALKTDPSSIGGFSRRYDDDEFAELVVKIKKTPRINAAKAAWRLAEEQSRETPRFDVIYAEIKERLDASPRTQALALLTDPAIKAKLLEAGNTLLTRPTPSDRLQAVDA